MQKKQAKQFLAPSKPFSFLLNRGLALPWDSRWCDDQLDKLKNMDVDKKAKHFHEAPSGKTRTAQQDLTKNDLRGSVDLKDKTGMTLTGELLRLMKRAQGSRVPDDERAMMIGPTTALATEIKSLDHWKTVEDDAQETLNKDALVLLLNMSSPEALAKLDVARTQKNKVVEPKANGKYFTSKLTQLIDPIKFQRIFRGKLSSKVVSMNGEIYQVVQTSDNTPI